MKKYCFNDKWFFNKQGNEYSKVVNLPHDAMISETRGSESPGGSAVGYFNAGIYEYKKTFDVPADWQDKHIVFQFEGVYKDSVVIINGKKAGGRPNGYFPFFVIADNLLKYGEENTIVVIADNSDMPNSRWYTGAGIYRPVWLYIGEESHIDMEGVKISTLSYNPARILIETAFTGKGEINVEILYEGKSVCTGKGTKVELSIPDAHLWSDENPELYECHVTLTREERCIDEVSEIFGVRIVEWGPQGLFVNGKQTLLRGGCVHHDNGILGACSFEKAEERRVKIMKQVGYNAIRSSHNPAAKSLLNACDRLGVYVIDETWDMWYKHKSKNDYATHFEDWYKKDIVSLVDRDFNHPSVIMYSIGNEVTEPAQQKGVELTKELVDYFHSLDKTRPVTCGINLWLIEKTSKGEGVYQEGGGLSNDRKQAPREMNSTMFNMITSQVGTSMNNGAMSEEADAVVSPCLDVLDIAGYNYSSGRYPLEGKLHPERVVVGSETFPQDIARNWEMVKNYPYLIGDFVWTSWDYIGEAGLGAWAYTEDAMAFDKPYPWLLADTGTIDILGNIGAGAEYAATVWGIRKTPYIGVQPINHSGIEPIKAVWRGTNAMPSWAWSECDGNEAVVEVYADADHVELLLNGVSLGKKSMEEYKAFFTINYCSGVLTAVAYDSTDKEIGRSKLESAIGEKRIVLTPEESNVNMGEIVYVDISLVGENNVVEMNNDQKLTITVQNGELLAFGSANPRTEESFVGGTYTTYYGRAQAVVRANNIGTIKVEVSGKSMVSIATIFVSA